MAKKWTEVSASPEFQALSQEDKALARDQYFTDVLSPQVGPEDQEEMRNQFISFSGPTLQPPVSPQPTQQIDPLGDIDRTSDVFRTGVPQSDAEAVAVPEEPLQNFAPISLQEWRLLATDVQENPANWGNSVPEIAPGENLTQREKDIFARTETLLKPEKEIGKAVAVGAAGLSSNLLQSVNWITGSKTALELSGKVNEWIQDTAPVDPTFLEKIATGIGSSAPFYILGLGTTSVANNVAKVAPKVAKYLGVAVSTVVESMIEGGEAWEYVNRTTGDPVAANSSATAVFFGNLALVGASDAVKFTPKGSILGIFVRNAAVETPQELVQLGLQGFFANRPVTGQEVFDVATTTPFVAGATSLGVSAMTPRVKLEKAQRRETLVELFNPAATKAISPEAENRYFTYKIKDRKNLKESTRFQPRDRDTEASRAREEKILGTFSSDKALEETLAMDQGTQIIADEEMVEGQPQKVDDEIVSGHLRKRVQDRLKKERPEVYAELQEKTKQLAADYGLEEQFAAAEDPVLVRVPTLGQDLYQIAKEANTPSISDFSDSEQAAALAGEISDSMVQELVALKGGMTETVLSSTNKDAIKRILDLVPSSQKHKMFTKEGELSKTGLNTIGSAIFSKAYKSDPGLLQLALEENEVDVRNIIKAMYDASPKMVQVQALPRDKGLDISDDVLGAVKKLRHLRREGTTLDDSLNQLQFFGEEASDAKVMLLRAFEENKYSASKMRKVIEDYYDLVAQEPDINQVDVFGGSVSTKESLLEKAIHGDVLPAAHRNSQISPEPGPAELPTAVIPTEEVVAPASEKGVFGKLAEVARTREVKPAIRHLTGQVKLGKLFDERIGLREVMRAQRRAAKTAFAAGKKVGVERQKAHAEAVAEARSLRKELRNRALKARDIIAKTPTQNLPLEYKTRLEAMKQHLDLNWRTNKTLDRRAQLKDFVQQQVAAGEPINIPVEQLALIDKTPLNDMTIEDLEVLAESMQQIAHIGKVKGTLLKIQEGRQVEDAVNEMVTSIDTLGVRNTIPEELPVTGITQKKVTPNKVRKAVRNFIQKNKRVERILEALDNYFTGGPNTRLVFDSIENAANESFVGEREKVESVHAELLKNKINISALVKEDRRINDRLSLTGEEMIEVYLASKDADKRRHLLEGNRITEEEIAMVEAAMTPAEKAYADWELENYWKNQYDQVNDVYRKLFNRDLPRVPGYNEIVILKEHSDIFPQEATPEEISKMLLTDSIRAAYIERGFTKERAERAEQPLDLRHFDNLLQNIEKVEHFKAFALPARDIKKLITHPKYVKAVKEVVGHDTYKIINDWYKDIVTRKPYHRTAGAPEMSMLRRHAITAMLGFNVLTGLKQTGSFFTAASLTSGSAILGGAYQVARDSKGVESFVYSRSPQLRNRAVERDIRELMRRAKASDVFAGRHTLSFEAMAFLRYFDKKTVLSVWKGAYDQSVQNKNTEEEAIKFADMVVRRTQPAFEIKDLPAFFRGGEAEKIITTFMNQRNQNWNLFVHDVYGKAKVGKISKGEALRRGWWMWVAPALALGTITRGRFRREPEELALDLLKFSPLAGTFLVGTLFESLLDDWDWGLSPFHFIREFQKTKRAAVAGDFTRAAKFGLRGAGYFAGFPGTSTIARTGQGLYDLLNDETDDLRRIIWSEYSLEGKDEGAAGGGPSPF